MATGLIMAKAGPCTARNGGGPNEERAWTKVQRILTNPSSGLFQNTTFQPLHTLSYGTPFCWTLRDPRTLFQRTVVLSEAYAGVHMC